MIMLPHLIIKISYTSPFQFLILKLANPILLQAKQIHSVYNGGQITSNIAYTQKAVTIEKEKLKDEPTVRKCVTEGRLRIVLSGFGGSAASLRSFRRLG